MSSMSGCHSEKSDVVRIEHVAQYNDGCRGRLVPVAGQPSHLATFLHHNLWFGRNDTGQCFRGVLSGLDRAAGVGRAARNAPLGALAATDRCRCRGCRTHPAAGRCQRRMAIVCKLRGVIRRHGLAGGHRRARLGATRRGHRFRDRVGRDDADELGDGHGRRDLATGVVRLADPVDGCGAVARWVLGVP